VRVSCERRRRGSMPAVIREGWVAVSCRLRKDGWLLAISRGRMDSFQVCDWVTVSCVVVYRVDGFQLLSGKCEWLSAVGGEAVAVSCGWLSAVNGGGGL
jgi:hypothetical protein